MVENGGMSVERLLCGKMRMLPEPRAVSFVRERTRWLVLRDGLRACIETMPEKERGLVTRLQEVWAYVDSKLDPAGGEEPEWPVLY